MNILFSLPSTWNHYDTFYKSMAQRLGFKVAHAFNRTMSNVVSRETFDVVIVGGGIVGTATARQLALKYV